MKKATMFYMSPWYMGMKYFNKVPFQLNKGEI